MIVSASRRTDIPAYYSDWFFNRIKEGFVLVRNPMNFHRISKISLSPKVVDGIVFWTKNPIPMLNRLEALNDYVFYFQVTLTAYGRDVEPNVSPKQEVLIPAFRELSRKCGKDSVIWRYDPILFSEKYNAPYHFRRFREYAEMLADATETCTVSFLDFYRGARQNLRMLSVWEPSVQQKMDFLRQLSGIASEYGIRINVCAENLPLDKIGILSARCVDANRLECLGGYRLSVKKDPNQRPACGCAASIDIGMYDTCNSGCLYCYANRRHQTAAVNFSRHDPASSLLFGTLHDRDVVVTRSVSSCRDDQLKFF